MARRLPLDTSLPDRALPEGRGCVLVTLGHSFCFPSGAQTGFTLTTDSYMQQTCTEPKLHWVLGYHVPIVSRHTEEHPPSKSSQSPNRCVFTSPQQRSTWGRTEGGRNTERDKPAVHWGRREGFTEEITLGLGQRVRRSGGQPIRVFSR